MVFPTLVSPRTSASSLSSFVVLVCSTSSTCVPFASRVFLGCVPHLVCPHPHHHVWRTPASIVCHTIPLPPPLSLSHPLGAKPTERHVDPISSLLPSHAPSLSLSTSPSTRTLSVCVSPLPSGSTGGGEGERETPSHERERERERESVVLGRRMRHDVVPRHGSSAGEAWNETDEGKEREDRRAWG